MPLIKRFHDQYHGFALPNRVTVDKVWLSSYLPVEDRYDCELSAAADAITVNSSNADRHQRKIKKMA